MLANPNISQIMPKAGNRYQSALAIAKRARNIENKRLIEGDRDIHDAVDVASQEIVDGKVKVIINGEYVDKTSTSNVIIDEIKDFVEE